MDARLPPPIAQAPLYAAALCVLLVLIKTCNAQDVLLTYLTNANQQGAVCLDGSSPAYAFDPGSGAGQNNWIVHLQAGGWCGSLEDCLQRSFTELGSSTQMPGTYGFFGYLSSSPSENPDFYNWNRVHVSYCDGGSFAGNADSSVEVSANGQTNTLYFRGQLIWEAVIDDLLTKGLASAEKAILGGDSAGGLAAFLHCNRFQEILPQTNVKCLCDGGFFMDIPNLAGEYAFRAYFQDIVTLHQIGILPSGCTSQLSLGECFFPEYSLAYINVPMFILQSPYDFFQVQFILAPSSSYSNGSWDACKQDLSLCSASQLAIIEDQLRGKMLNALSAVVGSQNWGLYMPSCYYHTQAADGRIWNGVTQINDLNLAQAFSPWYFYNELVQDIDCSYPCNPTCISIPTS